MGAESFKADFPHSLETARLWLRMPTLAHSKQLHRAILDSYPELQPWMSWAGEPPTYRFVEGYVLEAHRRFQCREEFPLVIVEKASGELIGGSGLHRIDWHVPKAEIGYWLHSAHTGRGLMTEAVSAICETAFRTLQMQRLEVRTSAANRKSLAIPARLGFRQEAVLMNDRREQDGSIAHTVLFAKTRSISSSAIG